MNPKNKIQFDELDLKCLNEMPLILDVLSATGNKVTRLLAPFYAEMNEIVKSNLKPSWKVGEKSYDCLIYPLTSENDNKISIKYFETYFKIESALMLKKIMRGKQTNYFWAFFGYSCYSSEGDGENCFYFIISKGELKERLGGKINDLKFYNQIKNKLSEYDILIDHPEKGDDNETITLNIDSLSVEKAQEGFRVFKESILIPFLKTLQ
jgi:hypothetical protein